MIESKLGGILKLTAKNLLKNKEINQTQYERYFVSGKLQAYANKVLEK